MNALSKYKPHAAHHVLSPRPAFSPQHLSPSHMHLFICDSYLTTRILNSMRTPVCFYSWLCPHLCHLACNQWFWVNTWVNLSWRTCGPSKPSSYSEFTLVWQGGLCMWATLVCSWISLRSELLSSTQGQPCEAAHSDHWVGDRVEASTFCIIHWLLYDVSREKRLSCFSIRKGEAFELQDFSFLFNLMHEKPGKCQKG